MATLGKLEQVIAQMEKYNGIETLFTPGTAEPGLDNFKCPLRKIISNMEK